MIKPVFYTTLLFWLVILPVCAQNLVYNGDFENYSECPSDLSAPFQNPKEIEKCLGWSAPTYGTSDYFNVCAVGTNVEVPINPLGEQSPFSGNGYLGGYFTNYTGGAGDDGYSGIMWWEYVQGQLIQPLEQGKVYKLSMEISLAEYSDLMISEIGVAFTDTPISSSNTASLTSSPQCIFSNPDYFRDTMNWMHLETYYMANGGEQYLTIGNFKDNVSTDTLRRYDYEPLIENPYKTYFYIDYVVLTETSSNVSIANVFTPNGDDINDYWFPPISDGLGLKKVSILNRWGGLVYEGDLNGFTWDGKTQGGSECSEGTYFYRISDTNITGFIQLVK